MGIYQIKVKGEKGIHSYETFLSSSVEGTVKEMVVQYEPEKVERVRLLFRTDVAKEAIAEIKDRLEEAFRGLRDLGELGWVSVEVRRFDIWQLQTLVSTIQEKLEEISSLIGAYYDITENKRSYFGWEE